MRYGRVAFAAAAGQRQRADGIAGAWAPAPPRPRPSSRDCRGRSRPRWSCGCSPTRSLARYIRAGWCRGCGTACPCCPSRDRCARAPIGFCGPPSTLAGRGPSRCLLTRGRNPRRPFCLVADLGDAGPSLRLLADRDAVADRLAVRQDVIEDSGHRYRSRWCRGLRCGGSPRYGADRPAESSPGRMAHWPAASCRAASDRLGRWAPASPACSRRAATLIAPIKTNMGLRIRHRLLLPLVRAPTQRSEVLLNGIDGISRRLTRTGAGFPRLWQEMSHPWPKPAGFRAYHGRRKPPPEDAAARHPIIYPLDFAQPAALRHRSIRPRREPSRRSGPRPAVSSPPILTAHGGALMLSVYVPRGTCARPHRSSRRGNVRQRGLDRPRHRRPVRRQAGRAARSASPSRRARRCRRSRSRAASMSRTARAT